MIAGNDEAFGIEGESAAIILGNVVGSATVPGVGTTPENAEGINMVGSTGVEIGGSSALDENVISGDGVYGISIGDSTNSLVQGNLIGTNLAGTAPVPNDLGVQINMGSTDNTIGGTADGTGNVISGNTGDGVEITGSGTTGNVVAGNFIGTDITGTTAIANGTGVGIDSGASANTIGGTTAAAHNVISGNTSDGIYLANDGSDDNLVEGDYIGVDMSGNNSVPNEIGVYVGSDDNTIGGTGAGSGNVISGNNDGSAYIGAQIYIPGNDNLVEGNLIGLGADGDIVTVPIGDLNAGVSFQTGGQNSIGSHNTIGGVTAAARNVISGNQSNIILQGGSYNLIEGNYIGTDTTGTIAIGPGPNGTADLVDINTESTVQDTIGGTTAGARNIISGASYFGIYFGAGTSESVVEGNYIGTDKTGTLALPNGTGFQEGDEGSPGDNTIGGATSTPGTGAGNLIAGNQGGGISIGQGDGDVVEGNAIGVVALPGGGTSPANRGDGIEVGGTEGAGVQIGGPSAQDQNVISGNTNDGIEINGSSGVLVERNLIGTDITGKLAVPNALGVVLDNGSTDNTIGGTTDGAGNVISGNAGDGVEITGSGTTGNVVAGNFIGTDITGALAIPNANGIEIDTSATGNTIGGSVSGDSNVISGNTNYGIYVYGAGVTDTLIAGNKIGTDSSGTVALPNSGGVYVDNATGTTIGGSVSGDSNVISGNRYLGISVYGAAATGTLIAGNNIGTDTTGTLAVPNDIGVELDDAGGAMIGGSVSGDSNLISGNGADGIKIYGSQPAAVIIAGNKIGTDSGGTRAVPNADGVVIFSFPNVTIGGTVSGDANVISGNTNYGIYLYGTGTTGTLIAGNKIGTDVNGTVALSNYDGVHISQGASANIIGGDFAETTTNLISGNQNAGVDIESGTSGNLVAGNQIGTDITGTLALANDIGIFVAGTGNTIGGLTAKPGTGSGNVISGNAFGMQFENSSSGNIALGNLIGTDISGAAAVPNGYGIFFAQAGNDTIGGTATGAANVISGNSNAGIWLARAGSTHIVIEGNLIGTDITGTESVPNAIGVLLNQGAVANTIGGSTTARAT